MKVKINRNLWTLVVGITIVLIFAGQVQAVQLCDATITFSASNITTVSGGTWADMRCVSDAIANSSRIQFNATGEVILRYPLQVTTTNFYLNTSNVTKIKLTNLSYMKFIGSVNNTPVLTQNGSVMIIPWNDTNNTVPFNSGSYFYIQANNGFWANGSIDGLNISNLGNSSSNYGVRFLNVNGLSIKNASFKYMYEMYIYNSSNISMQNVTISNGFEGIYAQKINDMWWENVTASNNSNKGIEVNTAALNVTLKNVVSQYNAWANIYFDAGSSFINVINLTSSDIINADNGIVLRGTNDSIIDGGRFYNNTVGITIEDASHNITIKNTLSENNSAAGFNSRNTLVPASALYGNIFLNNIFRNNKLAGIDFNTCVNCTASNNVFDSNGDSAILVRSSSANNTFISNTMINSSDFSTRWDYRTYDTTSNNTIQNVSTTFSIKSGATTQWNINYSYPYIIISSPQFSINHTLSYSNTTYPINSAYNITVTNSSIIPSSSSITVNVTTWNTTGDYYKKVNVTGNSNTAWIVGDNPINTWMNVSVNGTTAVIKSNPTGYLSFGIDLTGLGESQIEISVDANPPGTISQNCVSTEGNVNAGFMLLGVLMVIFSVSGIIMSFKSNESMNPVMIGAFFAILVIGSSLIYIGYAVIAVLEGTTC